jgi:hypothetical protein
MKHVPMHAFKKEGKKEAARHCWASDNTEDGKGVI